VTPVHEQVLDFPKGLVGFGDVNLAVIHAVEQVEGPRGRSSHRAGLGAVVVPRSSEDSCSTSVRIRALRPSMTDGGRRRTVAMSTTLVGRSFCGRPGVDSLSGSCDVTETE